MLETMVDCAHALGLAFGEAAKAETDTKRRLELFDAFQRSFLALRMGIRLSLTLRSPQTAPMAAASLAAERAEAPEREPAEHDPPEREQGESAERERDRDYEPVSLPKFLSTLGVVAREAARLDSHLPAETAHVLPTLKGLLAQASSSEPSPSAGVAVLARPPQARSRHQLLGSAATSQAGQLALPRRRSG